MDSAPGCLTTWAAGAIYFSKTIGSHTKKAFSFGDNEPAGYALRVEMNLSTLRHSARYFAKSLYGATSSDGSIAQ